LPRGRKKKSVQEYLDTYKEFKYVDTLAATKAEAARQYQEMETWREIHEKFDPEQMIDMWRDDGILDLIDKARKYRGKIYDRNRKLKVLEPEYDVRARQFAETGDDHYGNRMKEIVDEVTTLTNEQILNAWMIMKIYCEVREQTGLETGYEMEGDKNDYEYNAADAY
jgi:hypothetical protein